MGYKREICLNELTKLEDEKIIPAPVLNFQTDSCSLDDCTSKMRVKVGITLVAIEEHLKTPPSELIVTKNGIITELDQQKVKEKANAQE